MPNLNPKEEARLKEVFRKNKTQISPKGVAAAEAAARKALEEKYPGMFIPEKRTTPGVRRGR